MGLFLKQNEQRSQLQTKIAADLSTRLTKEAPDVSAKKPSPTILDDQRQTSPLAWIWVVIGAVAIVGLIVVLTVQR